MINVKIAMMPKIIKNIIENPMMNNPFLDSLLNIPAPTLQYRLFQTDVSNSIFYFIIKEAYLIQDMLRV
ncbi:hypothetical protein AB986_03900 [Alkalihalobacillus macyae]|uniref:Uncharacterized protein n=1 Tax=Guptibacillus hwajinpoensis TaxID=208199 RepID=A0A0J6CZA3_9BACL|nr:hypothetical protein AB986_03900 [Alkalihalobacillus macyae]